MIPARLARLRLWQSGMPSLPCSRRRSTISSGSTASTISPANAGSSHTVTSYARGARAPLTGEVMSPALSTISTGIALIAFPPGDRHLDCHTPHGSRLVPRTVPISLTYNITSRRRKCKALWSRSCPGWVFRRRREPVPYRQREVAADRMPDDASQPVRDAFMMLF